MSIPSIHGNQFSIQDHGVSPHKRQAKQKKQQKKVHKYPKTAKLISPQKNRRRDICEWN